MSVLTLNVDEVMRTLSAESSNPFVVHDKEVDIVRFAINSGFADIVLDGQVALRVMYQRPGETEVRAQTLTYYDTDGLHNYYDWQLAQSDLAKNGSLMVALCILDISGGEVSEWHTTPCAVRVLSTIHTDDSDEGDDTITPTVKERVAVLESMIQRVASGAPIVVASASAMTDTDQIYVLSTDGEWYYHNGSAWTAGGEYGAVSTDTTLTQSGIPADAKKVGDGLTNLNSKTNKLTLNSIQMSAGDATNIPENADLNDYILTTSGGIITAYGQHNYKVQTTAIAQTISNMPAPVAGALKVIELASGFAVMQLYMSTRERNIYVRYFISSTFTDWMYIATENDIESLRTDVNALSTATNKLALNSVQMSAGDATNIPENANLNDYLPGTSTIPSYGQHNFKVQTTTIARTIANIPAPVAGALKVMELAGGNYVLQLFMSVRERNIYVRYAVNSTFTDWVYIATEADIESLQAEIDANTGALQGKTDITSLFLHGSPFYSHCFLDATASETAANENVIPSESIHDIEFARRVGFKVIEANTQETADGQYVVIHGIDNNWGYEVYDLAGSDISSVAINTCTMEWIKEHVRYRSKYAKYRTVPLELTEWLKACRMNNLIPLVRIRKSEDIDLINNIMGKNNYIAYNASRSDTDGCLIIYVGSGVTNYDEFVERFSGTTAPAIIALGNWNSWSVDDVKKAVKWTHDRGLLIGAPGNYMTQSAIQKYYMLGFDVFASTSNIPPIAYGNLLNISSDEGYSSADFNTTGTVNADGVMVLNKGQYVELAASKKQSQYIAGATLFIRFSGSPIITMGSKFMPAFGATSTENRELQISTFYVEEAPSFRLKNNEDTPLEIYSLDFRASKL